MKVRCRKSDLAGLAAIICLCATVAAAAPARLSGDGKKTRERQGAAPRTKIHTGPVDELRDALYRDRSHRSAAAERLQKAWDALKRRSFGVARTYAGLAKSDPEFGDYSRWIAATVDIKEALQDYANHRGADASRLIRSAINTLAPLPENYPYSPLLKRVQADLAQAELLAGHVQCDQGKWSACEHEFDKAFERIFGMVDMVLLRPDDLASFAQACSQVKTELCTAWIGRLGHYYPHSTVEFDAIAKYYPNFNEEFAHPPYYGKNTQPYHAPDLDQAAFDDAMAHYLDGKYGDAAGAFRKFADEFPRSIFRYRAHYWLSQALLKQKNNDEAGKILNALDRESPLTYYGLLAALGNSSDFQSVIDSESPTATDLDNFLNPREIYHLHRAEKLIAKKAYDLAGIELHDLRARDALSNEFLVYLAMLHFESQSYSSAYPILNELIARGARQVYTTYMVKSIFPVQNWNWIRKYSLENGLDPILVMSLMKQESAFDAYAVSSTGALGLMQLMPATAAYAMPNQPRAELVKAEMNIRTGTKYLGRLLTRFNGNIVLALAAYNAGPGAVDRWVRGSPKDRGILEFIESIPYRETREYVSAVIRNYYWYSRRLNGPQLRLPSLDYFWKGAGQPPREFPPEAAPVAKVLPLASPTPVRTPSGPLSASLPGMARSPEAATYGPPTPGGVPVLAPSPSPAPSTAEVMGPQPLPTARGFQP